jgi:hypothetical protein
MDNPNTQPTQLPDPADSYERAKPQNASPQGTLHAPNPPVHEAPDKNAPEGTPGRRTNRPESDSMENSTRVRGGDPESVDHSMHDEEPLGWDQAPQDIRDKEQKRHSRTEGKGGVA